MESSIFLSNAIAGIVGIFVLFFTIKIYKKTQGASKAYYFWAQAAIFMFVGTSIALVGSIFLNPNIIEVNGLEGVFIVIQMSIYLVGYYYISLGTRTLPADLDITDKDRKNPLFLRKNAYLMIIIWSLFWISALAIYDGKIPIRLFYMIIYGLIWLYSFYAILPFYRAVREQASYWLYLPLGCLFGFFASLFEAISYLFIESLAIIESIFYALTGLFLFLAFYKLGKDLKAI